MNFETLSEKYGISYDDAVDFLEEFSNKNIIKEIEIAVRRDAYIEFEEEIEELTLLNEELNKKLKDIEDNYKLYKIESVADLIRWENIYNKK